MRLILKPNNYKVRMTSVIIQHTWWWLAINTRNTSPSFLLCSKTELTQKKSCRVLLETGILAATQSLHAFTSVTPWKHSQAIHSYRKATDRNIFIQQANVLIFIAPLPPCFYEKPKLPFFKSPLEYPKQIYELKRIKQGINFLEKNCSMCSLLWFVGPLVYF